MGTKGRLKKQESSSIEAGETTSTLGTTNMKIDGSHPSCLSPDDASGTSLTWFKSFTI